MWNWQKRNVSLLQSLKFVSLWIFIVCIIHVCKLCNVEIHQLKTWWATGKKCAKCSSCIFDRVWAKVFHAHAVWLFGSLVGSCSDDPMIAWTSKFGLMPEISVDRTPQCACSLLASSGTSQPLMRCTNLKMSCTGASLQNVCWLALCLGLWDLDLWIFNLLSPWTKVSQRTSTQIVFKSFAMHRRHKDISENATLLEFFKEIHWEITFLRAVLGAKHCFSVANGAHSNCNSEAHVMGHLAKVTECWFLDLAALGSFIVVSLLQCSQQPALETKLKKSPLGSNVVFLFLLPSMNESANGMHLVCVRSLLTHPEACCLTNCACQFGLCWLLKKVELTNDGSALSVCCVWVSIQILVQDNGKQNRSVLRLDHWSILILAAKAMVSFFSEIHCFHIPNFLKPNALVSCQTHKVEEQWSQCLCCGHPSWHESKVRTCGLGQTCVLEKCWKESQWTPHHVLGAPSLVFCWKQHVITEVQNFGVQCSQLAGLAVLLLLLLHAWQDMQIAQWSWNNRVLQPQCVPQKWECIALHWRKNCLQDFMHFGFEIEWWICETSFFHFLLLKVLKNSIKNAQFWPPLRNFFTSHQHSSVDTHEHLGTCQWRWQMQQKSWNPDSFEL